MTVTPRLAVILAALAVTTLVLPPALPALAAVALIAAAVVDGLSVRRPLPIERQVPSTLSLRRAVRMVADAGSERARIRQPAPGELSVAPSIADGRLEASLTGERRGRFILPPVAVRRVGPLHLGGWVHQSSEARDVVVYPDLVTARHLVILVRQGRAAVTGRRARGPLGLGTEFEAVREYQPDDDIRQVNWRATARLGRAMSNQYRVEQDRDVICLLDRGRLMAAPAGDRTRLDAAIDAVTAVALVADELGDRVGVVAFDEAVCRSVRPGRANGRAVVDAVFDLQPEPVESNYEVAFRTVGAAKRALVLVFTDLLDEAAARSLLEGIAVLTRRHAVVVAATADPDVASALTKAPVTLEQLARMSVAVDVKRLQDRVAHMIGAAGADVRQAPPGYLPAACVDAYVRAKRRARL
jgi:uncharacterized protein (DUF58 family)